MVLDFGATGSTFVVAFKSFNIFFVNSIRNQSSTHISRKLTVKTSLLKAFAQRFLSLDNKITKDCG